MISFLLFMVSMATSMVFNTTFCMGFCSPAIPGENLWRLTSQISDCVNFIASELEECCSVIDTCCSCQPTIIATLPYDIVVPGYYILKSDFTYNAIGTTPAISIDADHVVLDLCSHSLSQLQANVSSGVNGIQINSNHNDIEIRNGTVWGFTGNGIFADTGTTKLYIHDAITKFNGVRDTTAVAPGDNAGISIIGNFLLDDLINDVYIKDVQSYGNGGEVTGSGLQIVYANRIKIERFIGNDNGIVLNPFTALGDNGFGIFLNNCNDIECINCTTNHNGGNILGYGLYAQISSGMFCTQCVANSQLAGFALDGGLGSKVAGIALEVVNNFRLNECFVANSTNYSTVSGLAADANGVSGISVVRCIYGLLEECHVSNSNTPNGSSNFCHGFSVLGDLFGDISNCKDIVFKNCSAKNIGQTSSILDAIGFSTRRDDIISNGTQDLIFDSCVVEGVSGGGSNNNGFWLYDSLRSIIKNSTIKDCVSGIGAAIMVDGAGASLTKNLLISNIMHSNTTFGIFNTAGTTDTAAMNNYAYHNGVGGNFVGLPANTAIQTWVVGGGAIAAQTTPSFDNFDIVQPS